MKVSVLLLVFFVASISTVSVVGIEENYNITSAIWRVTTDDSKIYDWLKNYFDNNPFKYSYKLHSQSNGGGKYSVKLWNQGIGYTVTYFMAEKDIYTSVINAANNDDNTLQELENTLDDMAKVLIIKKRQQVHQRESGITNLRNVVALRKNALELFRLVIYERMSL